MRILIADFETTPFDYNKIENYKLISRFCCFMDIFTNEKYFFNIEKNGMKGLSDYIKSLCSLSKPTRIYFHNLRFDLAFLYDCIPKQYKYKIIRLQSKIIQFKVFKEYKRKDNRIQKITLLDIRDSLVLLPSSIEKLGKACNLPKIEIDYSMKEITNEYIQYCFRDIEIVKLSLENLITFVKIHFDYNLDIEKLPLTFPSLSKRIFNYLIIKKFGKDVFNKLYNKSLKYLENELREYYFGGRVEVFDFNSLENGFYNDVNSLYPFIMLENEFPIGKITKHTCCIQERCWSKWKQNKFIFGCLCYVYENQQIPLIPTKINDKLLFPNGKKMCFLFRKEIEYLHSLNQKVELICLFECQEYLPIFKEYIEIMYSVKQKSKLDSYDYLMSKLYMVSLYGKFAEKMEKESIEILHFLDNNLSELELNKISFNFESSKGFIKRDKIINKTLKTNIIFSMMITSLARLKLHQEILKSKKCYYSDTDSIVSKDLIENSKELGHLKPELTFKKFQALGCKEYIIQYIDSKQKTQHLIKMKGFGKLFTDNFNNFISEFENGKKQNRLIGFMESFVRNLDFNQMLVYDKYKQLIYDKRIILDDLTTRPFDLEKDDYNDMVENNRIMLKKIINKYQYKLGINFIQ